MNLNNRKIKTFRMNDISFSVATTASDQATWNGSNTVNGGSYAMQSTPYAEYLSLPFKLEPGTSTTNNTINTSNQQVSQLGIIGI